MLTHEPRPGSVITPTAKTVASARSWMSGIRCCTRPRARHALVARSPALDPGDSAPTAVSAAPETSATIASVGTSPVARRLSKCQSGGRTGRSTPPALPVASTPWITTARMRIRPYTICSHAGLTWNEASRFWSR